MLQPSHENVQNCGLNSVFILERHLEVLYFCWHQSLIFHLLRDITSKSLFWESLVHVVHIFRQWHTSEKMRTSSMLKGEPLLFQGWNLLPGLNKQNEELAKTTCVLGIG